MKDIEMRRRRSRRRRTIIEGGLEKERGRKYTCYAGIFHRMELKIGDSKICPTFLLPKSISATPLFSQFSHLGCTFFYYYFFS